MKATVSMARQTSAAKVSGGAASMPRSEREGGVAVLGRHEDLSSKAPFGMRAFYVDRKHTAVRHNKRSDGGHYRGFVDAERGSKERVTLIAPSDPPASLCL